MKIDPNVAVQLKDGDTIRFGYIDFTWKLEKVEIVVVTSTLNVAEKNNLQKDVSTLGGKLIDQWSDTCTHLVVKNLTLTVKVLQGLCHAIPIIKPEYFRAMLASIRSNGTLPKVETYQPQIVERVVGGSASSLIPNIDRKRLFVGKTFVFMNSKQMETFDGIIKCGMGECSSLDTKKWQKRSLIKPGVIVINDTSSSTQSQVAEQTANELNDFLRSKGSRMVPASEISLAVLHVSLEKFCNPNYKLKDNFASKSRAVPSTLLADNTPVNENGSGTSINSINVPETVNQSNTLASTVTSNSEIINLMDDDDDVMLVQGADLVDSTEQFNKAKRKNSTDDIEAPSTKKPNLNKSASPTTMETTPSVIIPQRSTRSATKIKNLATTESRIEANSVDHTEQDRSTKSYAEPATTSSQAKRNLSFPSSSQHERNHDKNSEKFSMEFSMIQGSQTRAAKKSQSNCFTSTQIEAPKRKRIAHRPTTSTFGGNDSDSDDGLFNFNNEPIAKKSRPTTTRDNDSDSDDNRNYPQSSGPVAPVPVSVRTFTQQSQYAPDSWLSRPTPSQTFTDPTMRTKTKKRTNRIEIPKSSNCSAGWQIGQWRISTPPIQIPTQGWYSKDTIKTASLEDEVKVDDSNEKTVLEVSKLSDAIKGGIQVITKSMNLMSTGGKVFKKQSFIVPSEIIKTTKVYEF